MESRRLKYLVAIVEEGSIGKAARLLRISQPALTSALRLLENELGVQLVERSATGTRPTEYGKYLYTHAKVVIGEIAHARAELLRLRDRDQRQITIGVLPTASETVGRAIIALKRKVKPELLVRVIEGQSFELLDSLKRREVSFIIGRPHGKFQHEGTIQQLLFEDRLDVVARVGHPLSERTDIAVADLLKFPWVYPITDSKRRPLFEEIFCRAGMAPPPASIEGSSVQFRKEIVRSGDYLTMLPQHSIVRDVREGLISVLRTNSEPIMRRVVVIWHEHHFLSKTAKDLIKEIRSASRSTITNEED